MHVITTLAEAARPFESASAGAAALWVFSAGVSALAAPDAHSSTSYQWLFRFLHLLAANLDRAGILEPTSRSTQKRV